MPIISLLMIQTITTNDINYFLSEAKGIIHIGAHTGEERETYDAAGLPVVWIEALASSFLELVHNLEAYPNQLAFNYLVTDTDDAEYLLGIAENDGISSSIFPLKDHKLIWPHIDYIGYKPMKSKTLKTIVETEAIDLSNYDTLILDVQGAELKVLEGAKDLLRNFRFIRVEAADFEIYEGCCLDHQLDALLLSYGFTRSITWQMQESTPERGIFEILYESTRTRKNTHIVDPETGNEVWVKVGVLTSVPRLGFQIHDTIMHNSFGAKGYPIIKVGGAFWEQAMQNGMNRLIELGCDYIITVDYDSIFHPDDVSELLMMAARYPQADAVAAWQLKRHDTGDQALMGFKDEQGNFVKHVPREMFEKEVTEADHTVFGLTLIKTASLLKMPKPWFQSFPNKDGEWLPGKVDADGYFWKKWKETGLTIFAANHAKIGHLAEFILWIDNEFNAVKQPLTEFYLKGRPF
jgi:FkbM family methyltransferase